MSDIHEEDSISYYNSRPAKRTGGGVLIFNQSGKLLLVKPTYRNTWQWPGGGTDDQESPLHSALRECEEEIGVRIPSVRPAFVNYLPHQDDGTLDSVHFVFIADKVPDNFINSVKVPEDEIVEARFVPIDELDSYMKPYRVRAVHTYLDQPEPRACLYLEDGHTI